MMTARGRRLLVLGVVLSLTGCGFGQRLARPDPVPKASGSAAAIAAEPLPKHPVLSTVSGHYIGVFEHGAPNSYKAVSSFKTATGFWPRVVVYYSDWKSQFATTFAQSAFKHGAMPMVEWQPTNVPMSAIATGKYDAFLSSYAQAVRVFQHPVMLSFGHEMNGNWYSWGSGHSSSSDFVAAWRHVVDVFRQAGALNAVWLWTVNAIGTGTTPFHQWWPGDNWVDMVGMDGYYYSPDSTFDDVFANTFKQVRTFTKKPVLIAETGIGPSDARIDQISGLFAGVKRDHLAGLIWFDVAQHGGLYHQDWRLENSEEALAAFRHGLKKIK